MSESSLLIYGVLTRAHVVLQEVKLAMNNSYLVSSEAKDNIIEAHKLIGKVLRDKDELSTISSDIDYQELVLKLQSKRMPITCEELEDVDNGWDEQN